MNVQRKRQNRRHNLRKIRKRINTFWDNIFRGVLLKKQEFPEYGRIQSGRERRKRRHFTNLQIYMGYIVIATLICIFAVQLSPGSSLRNWYYNLIHKPIINKDIQYMSGNNESQEINRGNFMTYYRYQRFGATNPEEVDPNAPMIAFTFDDGPNPDYTKRILDVLNANYSHATFFVVGNNAENYPDMLKAISSSGSEIGNHSYGHKDLTTLDADEVEEQIDKVNRAVKKATGENTTVIRPPYGAFNDDVLGQLKEPVILWDLDTEDWESRNAKKVAEKILDTVRDGDIVLMHDIYESTAEAVEIVVPKLKEQGYQIMSVSEMAHYKGKELELNKAYGKIQSTIQDEGE